MTVESASIFSTFGRDLSLTTENSDKVLKSHPQTSLMIDILSRKDNHHISLTGTDSAKIRRAYLEALALHLTETNNIPKILRGVDLVYLDTKRLASSLTPPEKISQDFLHFCENLRATNRRVIFAVDELNPAEHFSKLLFSVLTDQQWRVIILNSQTNPPGFTQIKLNPITDLQQLTLLKTYKEELEKFHNVIIPDETFASALSLAKHYLPTYSSFDMAHQLLDSAAARASATEHTESKPIVSNLTLTQVISNWTQIPMTHLQNNAFQSAKFIEALQRRIFGQDAALTTIASVLQHACLKLQEKSGPLCSFLLVGPNEVGKTTTVQAMAEHLFGHKNALLRVNLTDFCHTASDITIVCDDTHNKDLLTAIAQTPYAIVLIENIHQASPATLTLFKNIITQGYAFGNDGQKYDFRHAIIVMTTTLGSECITSLTQAPPIHETNKTLDLLQLVLSNTPQEAAPSLNPNLSIQDLCEELMPALGNYFSPAFLPHVNIIPFLPLDYSAIEKIVRLKVKLFAKLLETNFGIELNYAPEIIKFLSQETLWRNSNNKPLEKILEQHLYSPVANEIIIHADDKNRPKRLLLQLNDHGQLLRCEFMSAMGTAVYNL